MKNNNHILESFLQEENGTPDPVKMSDIDITIAQYNSANGYIPQDTRHFLIGGRNPPAKKVGTKELRKSLLEKIALLLPDVLNEIKSIQKLHEMNSGLPKNNKASFLIEQRIGELLDESWFQRFDQKEIKELLRNYSEDSLAHKETEEYLLDLILADLELAKDVVSFNEIYKELPHVDSKKIENSFFEKYEVFLTSLKKVKHAIKERKRIFNKSIKDSLENKFYDHFLKLVIADRSEKKSVKNLLFLYDQFTKYSSYFPQKCHTFFLEEVQDILVNKKSRIKNLNQLFTLEKIIRYRFKDQQDLVFLLAEIEKEKELLVQECNDLVYLNSFVSYEKNNKHTRIMSSFFDLIWELGSPLESSPIVKRMITLLQEAHVEEIKLLVAFVQKDYSSLEILRITASDRLRILIPQAIDGLKTLKSIKKNTGLKDASRLFYLESSMGESVRTELAYLRRELVFQKIFSEKVDVVSFNNGISFIENISYFDEFYFDERFDEYLDTLSLEQLSLELETAKSFENNHFYYRIEKRVKSEISKIGFNELVDLSQNGNICSEIKRFVKDQLKEKIESATKEDDWFIASIEKRNFVDLKYLFVQRVQDLFNEKELIS